MRMRLLAVAMPRGVATLAVATAAFAVLGAAAQEPVPSREVYTVILDPQASRITFTLGATLHSVTGSFRLREGKVHFEPATGRARGGVVVDAASGDSGNEKRDRDMHAKVLKSAEFPEIVFVPERVEGTLTPGERSHLVLHGRLDIHGGTHPVAIEADVRVDEGAVEAEGRFEVPYVEWGMKDPSKFILRVAKSVEIEIHAVGRLGSKATVGADDPGG